MIARLLLVLALGWWLVAPSAHAHLMPQQQGTLNIVGDGAFLVLSIPVSAFRGVDDDGDGRLTLAELKAHYATLEADILRRISLRDPQGPRPLQGLMVTLVAPDDKPGAPATQLVLLGRFALASPERALTMQTTLFGSGRGENLLSIRVTRGKQSQLLRLTSDRSEHLLFPAAIQVAAEYLVQGLQHIAFGADHLLFLMVVLAAGASWRQVALTLTCFTLGHGITLTLSALGGWQVPPAMVEPAIAATIVGMAGIDLLARQRGTQMHDGVRMALVFACSLVHGLGLAGALRELGLDSGFRLVSIAGFSLGIELGQLAVACVAGAALAALRSVRGNAGHQMALRACACGAMAMGALWFVQRVAALA
jgi:hypothetical protein